MSQIGDKSLAQWAQGWASRFDVLPIPHSTAGGWTRSRRVGSGLAMADAAQRYSNCLSQKLNDVLMDGCSTWSTALLRARRGLLPRRDRGTAPCVVRAGWSRGSTGLRTGGLCRPSRRPFSASSGLRA
jgi:hypothetical protein